MRKWETKKWRKWKIKKRRKWEKKKRRKWETKKWRKWEIKKWEWTIKKNNVVEDTTIKELTKIKSLEEDKNATNFSNWFDKNKFKNILAIINSNIFNNRGKIGEFKCIDIKELINKIRNNTISEISVKKNLNTLNELKNAEIIKQKKNALLNKKNY